MRSPDRTPRPLLLLGLALLLGASAGPAGRWAGTFTTPHGAQPLALELTSDGSAWTGRAVAGSTDLSDGKPVEDLVVSGDSISFGLPVTTGMGEGVMRFAGAVDGDEASGTYTMRLASMGVPIQGRWSAERTMP